MLQHRVALVTGSATGIGKYTALALAGRGATVVINYRSSRDAAETLVAEITAQGQQACALQGDVTDPVQVEQLIHTIDQRYGRLDILVNNVGEFLIKPLTELQVAEWQAMITSNLHSVFYLCRSALPLMRKQRWGRIINMGMAGADMLQASPNITPYMIAKTGVLILTRTLARLEAPYGITVNAISPGVIDNDHLEPAVREEMPQRIPAGRIGTPADITAALLFLVSDEAAYVTGTNLIVSGGWRL
ncbi:MAG: 3-oxoacyl-ACP reductase FabG [Nitrospinota bacterium]|nr:MAG: 3-oxoacyl-ACP reductase FabG [Nitrospinota bacterium]